MFLFFQENSAINVSPKQSYLSIENQPWHVVKMITILNRRMTNTQNTINKRFLAEYMF